MSSKKQVRVFLSCETYNRLVEWADYYGYGLSRACRIIINSAPLNIPGETDPDEMYYLDYCKEKEALQKETINENIESIFDNQL